MPTDRVVLVSGSTGKQGGAIARALLDRGWSVRAMTRKPQDEPARQLRELGAEVVAADLDDEASLRSALDNAWGALSLQNSWEGGVAHEEEAGKRFARVAKEMGIQHLVYQSVASAHRRTGIPHFESKWRIEETVRSLEFPSYVIIRPVMFMENLLVPDTLTGIQNGVYALAVRPDTKLQSIAVRDIGAYGLLAFESATELNGRAIDIAGDELTGPEMAGILSDVTGHRVQFRQMPIEQVRAFSEDIAKNFEWFDNVGYDVDIEKTSAEYGITPTRFRTWAAQQNWSAGSRAAEYAGASH
ncbi:MAG TPA: NmrA/HSCARG family protein [Gemmatimonadaceae bacterium]|nr:NmrA/HSCARG family protein [Gemmatimonadaceae bacterium]